jgi:hypothetical protein
MLWTVCLDGGLKVVGEVRAAPVDATRGDCATCATRPRGRATRRPATRPAAPRAREANHPARTDSPDPSRPGPVCN